MGSRIPSNNYLVAYNYHQMTFKTFLGQEIAPKKRAMYSFISILQIMFLKKSNLTGIKNSLFVYNLFKSLSS